MTGKKIPGKTRLQGRKADVMTFFVFQDKLYGAVAEAAIAVVEYNLLRFFAHDVVKLQYKCLGAELMS